MKKFSLLELLHPDGIAHTSLVLGSNCPEILRPELQDRFDGNADLFILAPSLRESDSQVWLEAAVQAMSDYLAADGIGYLFVPPHRRWRVMNLLRSVGLLTDTTFWHFPNLSSSRYLIPMQRFPGWFAIDTILPTPSLKRALATRAFQYSLTRHLLTNFWDPIGIAVRRPGARPLFQWLFPGEQKSLPTSAILRGSWRKERGASICYGFSGHDSLPSVIAKTVSIEKSSHLNREAKILENLGSEAHPVAVQVPKIIGRQQNDQCSSLLLSFIPGQSASDLLALKPDMFAPVMERIVDWLAQWHHVTAVRRRLEQKQLEQSLLTPLSALAPLLQNADSYRDWLVDQIETIKNPIPLVATHNDLTMANILFKKHDQMGVVDWETGCPESFPLVDFYYALTDAVRIAANSSDWLNAFKACYLPEGPYLAKAVAWRNQLQSAIDVPPGFAELCFHACWLHHAFNEQQVTDPGEPHPFLEIVQWLALHESNFNHK